MDSERKLVLDDKVILEGHIQNIVYGKPELLDLDVFVYDRWLDKTYNLKAGQILEIALNDYNTYRFFRLYVDKRTHVEKFLNYTKLKEGWSIPKYHLYTGIYAKLEDCAMYNCNNNDNIWSYFSGDGYNSYQHRKVLWQYGWATEYFRLENVFRRGSTALPDEPYYMAYLNEDLERVEREYENLKRQREENEK